MGVPKFFRFITRKYPNIIIKKKPDKFIHTNVSTEDKIVTEEVIQDKYPDTVDNLYLDMNCLIHPVCKKVLKKYAISSIDKNSLEKEMISEVCKYIIYLVKFSKPRKLLYMAIDGSAPRAKMVQQRMRRFRSVLMKKDISDIHKKLGETEPITKWESNAITPGTRFMNKLGKQLEIFIKKQKKHLFKDIEVILSNSNVPGEGEQKLFDYMKINFKYNRSEFTHVVYGLDADLIMLSMASNIENIYLLRESIHFGGKIDMDDLVYMDIDMFRNCLVGELRNINTSCGGDSEFLSDMDLVNDYIFLCFLLGNDFLPHLLTMTIDERCMANLLRIYNEVLIKEQSTLINVKERCINVFFLKKILQKLSNNEDWIVNKKREFYEKRRIFYRNQEFENEMEREMFLHSRYPLLMRDKTDDFIRLGEEGWRTRYYLENFNFEYDGKKNSNVKDICNNYFKGLMWTFIYYFTVKCPDWEWHYKYDHPPTLKDLVEYFRNDLNSIKTEFNESSNNCIKPFTQLLLVLPPQCHELLPKELGKLMINDDSPIIEYFPIWTELEHGYKEWYHECIPKMPSINLQKLRKVVNKVELDTKTSSRNQLQKEKIF